MKIIQINSVFGIGSTGRIVSDIHDALLKNSQESFVAYGRELSDKNDNVIRIGTKYDNYIHVAKTRIFDRHGFSSIKATKDFLMRLEEIDPDIIHLHNLHGYYINIELLFAYLKKINKPVIWTLHDCWSFTGHCAHFDYIGCEKWKTGCFKCPQKTEYPKSFLLDNSKDNYVRKKELFSNLDSLTVVTPSQWLAELVKKSYLKNSNIEVIKNGINLDLFKHRSSNFRVENNITEKFLILGVANNWTFKKGYYDFLKLAECLSEDERIVLVGVSETQLRELPPQILGITQTNSMTELSEIYSAADVYVNLTLEEVLGLTNVEALACGTPVITYDSGGSKECINDETGWVIEKNNIQKVYQTIQSIKRNEKFINHDKCIIQASKNFDRRLMIQKYLELYEKMMNNDD